MFYRVFSLKPLNRFVDGHQWIIPVELKYESETGC